MAYCARLSLAGIYCALVFLAQFPAFAQPGFSAADLSCSALVAGQRPDSPNHQSFVQGRLWALGYLAGYYVASEDADLVSGAPGAGPVQDLVLQMCQGFPESSLLSISMLTLSAESLQLPTEPAPGFEPAKYTCAEYSEHSAGENLELAGAAELWASAFLQGHQNVEQPYVVLPADNMTLIMSVISNGCRESGEILFLDYATGVARAVRVDTPR